MEERFLYHIWDAGHLQADLKTVSGKTLQVIYPGQFNTNRGPDFVNAILSINGEEVQGSVEIHVSTLDWQRHNHQEDKYFNPVALHVVHQHNSSLQHTIKENGELVEILELKHQLSEDIEKLIQEADTNSILPSSSFCDLLSGIDKEHLLSILTWQGRQRLAGKLRRFNAALSLANFDQILYEGLMEAAGYDKNKLNMAQLAQAIPFAKLQEWYQDGLSALDMAAILCISSGLLEKSKAHLSPQAYDTLRQAYERQAWHGRKILIDWQLFRIRPVNHPLKRMLLLCEFLYASLETGLLSRFIREVESNCPDSKARHKGFSAILEELRSPLLDANIKLGKQVINSSYLNIYIPVMLLYAQKIADNQLQDSLYSSWDSFPALSENYITRYMSSHINAGLQTPVKAKSLYQQGLINLYYCYCRYHLCSQCVAKSC